MAEPLPLILDVDTGIDDSLALLYAAASPEAELVAVTCVSGNVDARQVGSNTRAVLELAGRDRRRGRDGPRGAARPAARDHARDARPAGPRPRRAAAAAAGRCSDRHAVDLIIDEARRRPGEITLVTLGPLTNLAVAVLREPELPRLLKGYVLMGGAYRRVRQHGARRPSGTSTATRRRPRSCSAPGSRDGRTRRSRGRSRWASTSPSRRDIHARPHRPRSPAAPAAARTNRSRSDAATTRWRHSAPWPRTRSFASSPTRCASTWSSTPGTTASTARSSTTRWRSRPRWTAAWSRPRRSPSTSRPGGKHHDRRDRRRLAPARWGRPPNLDVAVDGRRRDVPRPFHRTRRRAGGGAGPNVAR